MRAIPVFSTLPLQQRLATVVPNKQPLRSSPLLGAGKTKVIDVLMLDQGHLFVMGLGAFSTRLRSAFKPSSFSSCLTQRQYHYKPQAFEGTALPQPYH